MNDYQKTINTWNLLAQLYQNQFMDLDIYNHTYDLLCKELNNNEAKVFEIGCGPGNIGRYLLSKLPKLKYLATDVSPKMIELAKANMPSANCEVMDARLINKIKGQFDLIIGGFCLPYLTDNDAVKFIKDGVELLSNKGLFYLSFVEGDKSKSGMIKNSRGEEVYFNFFKPTEIIRVAENNGLKKIHNVNVKYTRSKNEIEDHVVLIFRKN